MDDVQQAVALEGFEGAGEEQDQETEGDQSVLPLCETKGVHDAGVAHARRHQDEAPKHPAGPTDDAEHDQGCDDEARRPAVKVWGDGVEDVAAVELSGGNEIERGDEQADPTGGEDGMGDDRRQRGLAGEQMKDDDREWRLHVMDQRSRRVGR